MTFLRGTKSLQRPRQVNSIVSGVDERQLRVACSRTLEEKGGAEEKGRGKNRLRRARGPLEQLGDLMPYSTTAIAITLVTAALALGIAAADAEVSNPVGPSPHRPVIAGEWRRIAGSPDLGE